MQKQYLIFFFPHPSFPFDSQSFENLAVDIPFTCYCTRVSIVSSSAITFRFTATVVGRYTFRERSSRECDFYGLSHRQR